MLGLGVFADLPCCRGRWGWSALGLLLAFEWFRRNAALFHDAPILLEWLVAAAGFAAILVAMRVVLAVVFADAPSVELLLRYLVATVAAYPLVVLGVGWCLHRRAPHRRMR